MSKIAQVLSMQEEFFRETAKSNINDLINYTETTIKDNQNFYPELLYNGKEQNCLHFLLFSYQIPKTGAETDGFRLRKEDQEILEKVKYFHEIFFVDIKGCDVYNKSLIDYAVERNLIRTFSYLVGKIDVEEELKLALDFKEVINLEGRKTETSLLFEAVQFSGEEMVREVGKLLSEAGIDVNKHLDRLGESALFKCKSMENVAVLKELGLRLEIKNKKNKTAKEVFFEDHRKYWLRAYGIDYDKEKRNIDYEKQMENFGKKGSNFDRKKMKMNKNGESKEDNKNNVIKNEGNEHEKSDFDILVERNFTPIKNEKTESKPIKNVASYLSPVKDLSKSMKLRSSDIIDISSDSVTSSSEMKKSSSSKGKKGKGRSKTCGSEMEKVW